MRPRALKRTDLRNRPTFLLAAFILGLSAFLSRAQETAVISRSAEPIPIPKLGSPIVFDGLSTEEAWRDVGPLPMIMMMPNFGFPPSEKTEVLVAFDDHFLWIAGRMFDREPSKVQAPSKKRDYMEQNTDWFGIILDTFNDKENGLAFFTTPSGLRWDGAVMHDAETRMPMEEPVNLSWNTFWDVKTVVNEEGWFVEMRIPFSSLRFQDKNGRVIMGLLAWRWIARKSEQIVFPSIYPKWGQKSAWKPSQAQEIILDGIRSRHPLYIAPFVLAGSGYAYDLNDEGTAYVRHDSPSTETGLDIKYGLTSNLTFDLTINPDFAQVEADDQQVNLTRFVLFFPEKRLFFQERAAVFDFNFGGFSRVFYSRRIGLSEDEDGESHVVPIYGGLRLVGRAGPWDLGFMTMQTAPLETQGIPLENSGVFRFRRRVFNPYSYVGGIITSRIGKDGSYNICYGLDGIFRLSGDDYLTMAAAQSLANGLTNNPVSLDPSRLRINYERRTQKGLGYYFSLSRAGRDYDPGLGFEMREDFIATRNEIAYGWIPGESSFLQSHRVNLRGFVILRNEDLSVETAELGPGWEFNTKSGSQGMFSLQLRRESIRELFEFSAGASVPPGEYTFLGIEGMYMTPQGRLFSTMVMVDAGSFYDGWRTTLGIRPSWSPLHDLTLSGHYEINRVEFSERGQGFTAHLVQLRLLATLNTKISALAFIQYNGADDLVIGNLRLRYNPAEGNDLYLVYNEVLNTDRMRDTPRRPWSDSRALIVKYSYTFNF